MKPLSEKMACLLGIQNEIQAAWEVTDRYTETPWESEDQEGEWYLNQQNQKFSNNELILYSKSHCFKSQQNFTQDQDKTNRRSVWCIWNILLLGFILIIQRPMKAALSSVCVLQVT